MSLDNAGWKLLALPSKKFNTSPRFNTGQYDKLFLSNIQGHTKWRVNVTWHVIYKKQNN